MKCVEFDITALAAFPGKTGNRQVGSRSVGSMQGPRSSWANKIGVDLGNLI